MTNVLKLDDYRQNDTDNMSKIKYYVGEDLFIVLPDNKNSNSLLVRDFKDKNLFNIIDFEKENNNAVLSTIRKFLIAYVSPKYVENLHGYMIENNIGSLVSDNYSHKFLKWFSKRLEGLFNVKNLKINIDDVWKNTHILAEVFSNLTFGSINNDFTEVFSSLLFIELVNYQLKKDNGFTPDYLSIYNMKNIDGNSNTEFIACDILKFTSEFLDKKIDYNFECNVSVTPLSSSLDSSDPIYRYYVLAALTAARENKGKILELKKNNKDKNIDLAA